MAVAIAILAGGAWVALILRPESGTFTWWFALAAIALGSLAVAFFFARVALA